MVKWKIGWEFFTDQIVMQANKFFYNIIFILKF